MQDYNMELKTVKDYIDVIPRCPECNLIPSLRLKYNDKKDVPSVIYKCERGHDKTMLLEKYMKEFNKYSLTNEKCEKCGKSQKEIKEDLFYDNSNDKFICYQCQQNKIKINYKKFDFICKLHLNPYSFYCNKCEKNICSICKLEHKYHDLIDLSEFTYLGKDEIKLKIDNIKSTIKNLEKVRQEIVKLLDKLKKSTEIEMYFINNLLSFYEYSESHYDLNYNIKQNLKNFINSFKLNKIDNYELVIKEGNKYISFLQEANNFQYNCFNNIHKTINNSNSILYLSVLKDGRLAAAENNVLNIYKKNSFYPQLSIREHNQGIPSFTQLNDGRIITCSDDNSMKLIELKENEGYELQQTLKIENSARKIIEIKENLLVSVSCGKEMKVWKKDDKNRNLVYVKDVPFQNDFSCCNIIKLNDNEFATSSVKDKCIKFWNSNNFDNFKIINNIETHWCLKTMCLIDEDILCVAGINSMGLNFIRISSHNLIKNENESIDEPKSINCINSFPNGLLLCSLKDSNNNNTLVKYQCDDNLNLEKIAKKEQAHSKDIFSCDGLSNGMIVSGGEDATIKIWSYFDYFK